MKNRKQHFLLSSHKYREDSGQSALKENRMADIADTKLYKEEVTKNGAMKIEVVLEEAKKRK